MALADFIQALQEQDTVYSEPQPSSITVISPEQPGIKVIPPESVITTPKVLKLNLKQKPVQESQVSASSISEVQKPVEMVPETVPKNTQPVIEKQQKEDVLTKQEVSADELFLKTGTEWSKKGLWLEYYEKAKRSTKTNEIVVRMKAGRFTITPDNDVLLLPDYDIVGKDPDAVLRDSWF